MSVDITTLPESSSQVPASSVIDRILTHAREGARPETPTCENLEELRLKLWSPIRRDEPRPWYIIRDTQRITPLHVDDAETFAQAWRESVPDLRASEMLVRVEEGENVEAILMAPSRPTNYEIAVWCNRVANGQRFAPASYPWSVWPEDLIYLPAVRAAPIVTLRDRRSKASAISGYPTGLACLDAVLCGGYLPSDALVGVGGLEGAGKTLLQLAILEGLAKEPRSVNVFYALDQPERHIRSRRLQRSGLSREEARAAVGTDAEDKLNAGVNLEIVPRVDGELFEDFLALVLAGAADGQQVNLVVDSVQKLETREGVGRGDRERVGAASRALRAAVSSQSKLRILFSSELALGSGNMKDSGSLKYDADLNMLVTRSENELRIKIKKSRYGGENEELKLAFDENQRLTDPGVDGLKVQVWNKIQAVLAETGKASGAKIEDEVKGDTRVVRQVLKERVAVGDLVPEGKGRSAGYRLVR